MALNKVILQGRLCSDVEVKHTPQGVSVATFRIAVDHDKKNKDTGERGCDFISIVAWRESAEFIYKWFHKGDSILLEGRLTARQYVDKDGNKRTSYEVVMGSAYFGGPKKDSAKTESAPFYELPDDDGPIPF